jgi:hypothetical protein
MSVMYAAMRAIALMRCAKCNQIMSQGERERNPRTETGRPIHQQCLTPVEEPTKP